MKHRFVRDERGIGELLIAGLITLAIVAGGVVVVSVQSIMQGVGRENHDAANGIRESRAFIGPRGPGGAPTKCTDQAARDAGLTWTTDSLGYRKATGDDEPRIADYLTAGGGGQRKYNTDFARWYSEMEGLYAQAKLTWERLKCGEEPPVSTPSQTLENVSADIPGVYQLELRNPPCTGYENSLPKTLTVATPQKAGEVQIQFEGHSAVVLRLSGYDVNGEWDENTTHLGISMRFVTQSGRTIVQGVFKIDVGGGCHLAFQGHK